MRNIFKWAPLAALFVLFSCAKIEYNGEIPVFNEPGVHGYITPLVEEDAANTKASVTPERLGYVFEVGDRVNIWSQSGTLLVYYVSTVSESGIANFDGDGFKLTDGLTYHSSVPPVQSVMDSYHALTTTFEGQVQAADNDANHTANYTYTYASATCNEGATSFSYQRLNAYFRLIVTLPEALTLKELTIEADSDDFFALNGTSDISAGTFTRGSTAKTMTLKLGAGNNGFNVSDGVLNAFLSVAPCEAGNYIIRVVDSEDNVYTSPVISKTAVAAGTIKRFEVEVFPGEDPAVAQIGETVYYSLVDAVADVPTDGTQTTITMIGDETINVVGSAVTVASTKNIILDLNGHQVVGVAEGGSTNALITNKGTLTIKDSSDSNADGTGSGKLISGATTNWIYNGDGNYSGSYASNTITNTGTLTIQSGYIENLSTGSATYAVDNNSSGANAILNVSGGIIKANAVAVREFANSTANENTVNVSGGTITAGVSGIWIQLPGSDATKAMKAALNVTGGTIEATRTGTTTYAFYDYSYGNSFDATQYNLSGGTFNGDYIFSYGANINVTGGTYNCEVAIKQTNPSTVSVSGGKFASDVYTYGTSASTGFITGGIFAEDPSNYVAEDYIVTANTDPETKDDYPYTVVEDTNEYVAKIGDTKYLTLEAAFAAAEDGDTITLLADCAGNGIVAPQGKFSTTGLTVDFNNHTYNFSGTGVGSSGTQNNGFQLLQGNTITFKNGTITASSEDAGFLIQNYSNLTLQNMVIDGSGVWGGYVLSNNNGNVTIDGTTITAPSGDFAFDVCRYSSYPSVNVTVTGASVINGNVEVSASGSDPKDGFSLTVEAGTFNGDLVIDGSAATAMANTPAKAVIKKDNDVTLAAPAGFNWIDNGDGTSTLGISQYVAQIGETKYESLADAIAAVPDNTATTITMIGNEVIEGNAGVTIATGKNVTLDLNGKTVTLSVTESKGSQLITNRGNLTITDSSSDQNGKLTNVASEDLAVGSWPTNNYVTNIITNSGTLNIEAGIIQSTADGSICYAVDNNSTSYDAILNVNGGYLTSVGTVIRQFCNSTTKQNVVNVSGGTVETNGYTAIWTQLPGSDSNSKKLATLNITGGVVKGASYAWYDYSYGDSFEAVNYSISGGELYGDLFSYAVYNGVKPGFVTGGLFSEDVSSYCAECLACVPSDDHPGMYEIGLAEVYYSWMSGGVEEGEYCTFAAPFVNEWLMDGEFITLQKNITLTQNIECLLENGSFTLTLGNYSISKGSFSVSLKPGVSVVTDKQTDIFSAAEVGSHIVETVISDGDYHYKYTAVSNVAKIGNVEYETLEAAFAAVQDGQTITLLADCAGNGIIAPQGQFTSGVTVDFNGFTYTMDGEMVGSTGTQTQAFQLLKDNKITFKNGTITSSKAKMLVQNYSDLTLQGMTLTLDNANYSSAYTLSNNNGTVVIDGTTINANPAGGFAFDVCRYASYPSVNVTVKGASVINGNVEVSASGGNAMNGFSLTVNAGSFNGDLVVDSSAATVMSNTPEKGVIRKADTVSLDAPADFKWESNGDGTSTLKPVVNVAKIGNVEYETLEAAFAAVQDGQTITLLADCAGNGIIAPQGQFTSGVTVDFNGFTYTMDGEMVGSTGTQTQAFQLLKDNKITFKNGTIESSKALMLIQNYSDLTLEGMTLNLNTTGYNNLYTLSNNNGNVVIDGTTINAASTNNSFAFDVCRYSSYPSVNVTVKGASVINGNVEVSASGSDPKDGFSLTVEAGTFNGDLVIDGSAATAMASDPDKVSITKNNAVSLSAPSGFQWVVSGSTSTLVAQ